MSWRSRHPYPKREDYDTEEEWADALNQYYDAEDMAAEEYLERKLDDRQ